MQFYQFRLCQFSRFLPLARREDRKVRDAGLILELCGAEGALMRTLS